MFPQLPQWLLLLVVSVHAPAQTTCPIGHGMHVPLEHKRPVSHVLPTQHWRPAVPHGPTSTVVASGMGAALSPPRRGSYRSKSSAHDAVNASVSVSDESERRIG